MKLLSLLKQRYEQAEKFTKKNFIEDIERSIKDYEAKEPTYEEIISAAGIEAYNKRYEFTIPMIFTNVEAMKASLWDRLPDLIFKGRGSQDDDKKKKVNAAYEYLKDKLDLESFAYTASHWFILGGFVSARSGFKSETYEAPMYDEMGQPMIGPDGQPEMQTLYSYNDPVLEIGDPCKEVYSPESEFSIDASGVPFQLHSKLMNVEEIKRIYGKEVTPDVELKIDGYEKKDNETSDIKRAKVFFYNGQLPDDDEVKLNLKEVGIEWQAGVEYYLIYVEKELLYGEIRDERFCRLAKWYGSPNSFFGFGLGKIGRNFQKEKSIRRGQQIRLADVAAFAKIAVKNDGANKVDVKKLQDPREQVVIFYETEAPTYMQLPNISHAVTAGNDQVDQDAQRAFGMMDISTGAQSNSMVDTATGQTIFSEAAERRVRLAKKLFMKFYKEVVIMLLKLAQKYWDEQKLVTITDEDGQQHQETISAEDLKDIDFDKDIEIDAESATYNKDIVRQQYVALYDKTKDDPLINRRTVVQDMVRYGFDQPNPERYLKQSEVPPGTTLTDPTGIQYTVNEAGDVVSAQTQNELATPSGDAVAGDQSALHGSIQ